MKEGVGSTDAVPTPNGFAQVATSRKVFGGAGRYGSGAGSGAEVGFGSGSVGGFGLGLGGAASSGAGRYNPCGFGWLYRVVSGVGVALGSGLGSASGLLLGPLSVLDLGLDTVFMALTTAGGNLPPAKMFWVPPVASRQKDDRVKPTRAMSN